MKGNDVMYLTSRIERLNRKANQLLREEKSDILVMVAPSSVHEKGWYIAICHNYKTGEEKAELREQLEACNTLEEVASCLDGYASNINAVQSV